MLATSLLPNLTRRHGNAEQPQFGSYVILVLSGLTACAALVVLPAAAFGPERDE